LVQETGEIYFENNELSRKYQHQLKAADYRLGNIAEISALREEVARLVAPDSLILQKVLCTATHSGDTLPVEFLPRLLAELNSISNSGQQSRELQCFVSSLQKLVRAAQSEGNPIVFL
jgi:hypothetical protein